MAYIIILADGSFGPLLGACIATVPDEWTGEELAEAADYLAATNVINTRLPHEQEELEALAAEIDPIVDEVETLDQLTGEQWRKQIRLNDLRLRPMMNVITTLSEP